MPFDTKNISVMDLSKSVNLPSADLNYALYQVEYHLRQICLSMKEVNHHLDKYNEWIYFVGKLSKNLNE
jgi:hypothetical protein